MSKSLATKVSTSLVKMSKLGPKCQYFVWPPLFSSTTFTLFGMEFTKTLQYASSMMSSWRNGRGFLFHSSMTTSRSWWMLETLCSSTFRLRLPHRCSIGFMSGVTWLLASCHHCHLTFGTNFLPCRFTHKCLQIHKHMPVNLLPNVVNRTP